MAFYRLSDRELDNLLDRARHAVAEAMRSNMYQTSFDTAKAVKAEQDFEDYFDKLKETSRCASERINVTPRGGLIVTRPISITPVRQSEDPEESCEFVGCEASAYPYSVGGAAGYVSACSKHAHGLLVQRVLAGDVVLP